MLTGVDLRPAAVQVALDAQELVALLQAPGNHERKRQLAEQVARRAAVVAAELGSPGDDHR